MKHLTAFAYCLLSVVLISAGCSGKSHDYQPQPMGSAGYLSIFRWCDLTWQEHRWVLDAARTHDYAFTCGYTVVAPNDVYMSFSHLPQPVLLVAAGQTISRPAYQYSGYNTRHSAVVDKKRVRGATPTGPGLHFRTLRKDQDGNTVIMIELDAECTMHGLYTMLIYANAKEGTPTGPPKLGVGCDEVEWYRWWAEVYEMDREISNQIRAHR